MNFQISDLNFKSIDENDIFYQEITILISKRYNVY